jgi:carbamoyl-phosphate synthase large subunit
VNLLITSASRKVSLVRAFQSALALTGGGKVIAVDTNSASPALFAADQGFIVPRTSDQSFRPHLFELCSRERIELIIPTRDEELPLFAELRHDFLDVGIHVMVSDVDTVRLCQDKQAFSSFCRERKFGVPRNHEASDGSAMPFPVFVKPRFGKGGYGARRVDSEEELLMVMRDAQQWVIQEFVGWPEYTVDLLADFDGQVISAVPRERQLTIAGESYVSRTVKAPGLMAESARLAAELGLKGHNTIQCFWNGKEAKFIEVNPRFGGAAALGIAAGAGTPEMILRLAKGERVEPRLGLFDTGLVMLRFTDDVFLRTEELNSLIIETPREPKLSGAIVKPALTALIFDLDNTLYPEEQFVRSGFRAAAECLAVQEKLDAQVIAERMLNILCSEGRGRVFNRLLDELKIEPQIWLPTLLQVYRSHRPRICLFPGVVTALDRLKRCGVKLALVTDGATGTQLRKIAALQLERYMDATICTGELGPSHGKPSTVAFDIALKRLRVDANNAAYIADDVSKDFAGPNKLGMKSVRILSEGLLGVKKPALPEDPIYRPKLQANSIAEAISLLGLQE